MATEKTPLLKDIEELVQKSIEANKLFISEGTKFIQQLGSKKTGEIINPFKADTMTNTVTAFMRLNIQHLKNMVDLGISLTKDVMSNNRSEEKEPETVNQPAFILQADGKPGSQINLQFVVENVKTESAVCSLINSGYTDESTGVTQNFITGFAPVSFTLEPGNSQSIGIQIAIPRKTAPGIYISKAQVQGFEPAFFIIQLTITEL